MEKPPLNVAQKYLFTFSSWLPWAIQTYRPTVYKTGVAAAISLVLVTYLTLLSHWGSGSPCRHDITSENWFYHWKKQSIHIRVRRKLRTLWDCAPSNSHYSRNHKVFVKKPFKPFLVQKDLRQTLTLFLGFKWQELIELCSKII